MPPLGKQIAGPERATRPLTEDEHRRALGRITAFDRALFFVMHELLPYTEAHWWHKAGLANPSKKTRSKARPHYHHDTQPHHHDTQVWLERKVGSKVVQLWAQEREVAGRSKHEETMFPFGEPKLQVATNQNGGVSFPTESAYLFTVGQHEQARIDALDTLRLFAGGKSIVDAALEDAQASALKDLLGQSPQ